LFRHLSRETGISTPTVKAKIDRLINIRFIESISPIFDFEKVTYPKNNRKEINTIKLQSNNKSNETNSHKIKKGVAIKMKCNYCHGLISGKTHILKFSNHEQFFCCIGCKPSFREKYRNRIEAIIKRQQH
jgi:DNA-binding Lrp family transcriptional regulator